MTQALLIVLWLAGVVLAQGFASTFWAVVIPFYAWYLVIERVMSMAGMIGGAA